MPSTPRGDFFQWQISLPTGTWSGLIGTAQLRTMDRLSVVHSMSGALTINGDGSALMVFTATKATTRTWAPGDYRIDAELERPGVWGPFTFTMEEGNEMLTVAPDATITTA